MSAFTDHDAFERVGPHLAGDRAYRLTDDLPWEIGKKGSGLWLTVPKGFVFDVSSPWIFRWLVNPHDKRFLKAAALHDYALSLGWDRVSSAAVFSEGLKAQKVGKFFRFLLVVSVIWWKWE